MFLSLEGDRYQFGDPPEEEYRRETGCLVRCNVPNDLCGVIVYRLNWCKGTEEAAVPFDWRFD